jgi:antitoxin (DNA-binding transcriptional repressor) of toxin-antitoxin stability system
MQDIPISKFKATCLAILDQVLKTGQPVLVTRFGHPIAEIYPPASQRTPRRFGARIGSGKVIGDIVGPISDETEWNPGLGM